MSVSVDLNLYWFLHLVNVFPYDSNYLCVAVHLQYTLLTCSILSYEFMHCVIVTHDTVCLVCSSSDQRSWCALKNWCMQTDKAITWSTCVSAWLIALWACSARLYDNITVTLHSSSSAMYVRALHDRFYCNDYNAYLVVPTAWYCLWK